MSDKIKIAIVGCGRISYVHIRGYNILLDNGIDNFQITATCDIDKESAERLAGAVQQFQLGDKVSIYNDFEQLAHDKVADAVDICTSVSSHHTIALTALENGTHVTVEKPFAITVKSGLWFNGPVKLEDIVSGKIEGYQKEINEKYCI